MQANPPVQAVAAPADAPGLGEYFSILRKRRRLLLLVAGPIIALGVGFAVFLPDVYRSQGLLEIDESDSPKGGQSQDLKSVVARDSDEPQYADQYVQSLGTIVLSDKNLTQLLKEHTLYDDQNSDPGATIQALRSDIRVDIVTTPILDPESGRERNVVTAFTVSYDNRDPHRAREGARWLVDAYLKQNRLDREQYASGAAKFFGAEAERVRKHVNELEAKLAVFKAKNVGKLPELNQMNMNVMDRTENDLQNVDAQIQALRRDRVFIMSQLQQAQSTGPEAGNLHALEDEYQKKSAIYDASHPDMIALRRQIDLLRQGGSPTGQSLQQQLQMKRSILAETRQRYSDEHPDVKKLTREIQALEARIASGETADRSVSADSPVSVQLQTQLSATDTQIAALTARSAELRAKLTDLESRMTSAPEVERDYQIVTRDLESARTQYQELLKRQMDAEVSAAAIAGGTADKFRVKSQPGTPDEPAKPQRIAIVIIAVVMGTILGLSAIVVAQLLDQTVRGVRDIREILDIAPLSAVPIIRPARHGHRRFGFSFAGRSG